MSDPSTASLVILAIVVALQFVAIKSVAGRLDIAQERIDRLERERR